MNRNLTNKVSHITIHHRCVSPTGLLERGIADGISK
jgi:hypothetical protein